LLSDSRQAGAGDRWRGICGQIGKAVQIANWQLRLRDAAEPAPGPAFRLINNSAIKEPHSPIMRRSYIEPFFHIEAGNGRWDSRQGFATAFRLAFAPRRFACCLNWCFKDQAISAEADDRPARITARPRQHGWPL
jgi:hypothetical protein